jgi:hypothetical protein
MRPPPPSNYIRGLSAVHGKLDCMDLEFSLHEAKHVQDIKLSSSDKSIGWRRVGIGAVVSSLVPDEFCR